MHDSSRDGIDRRSLLKLGGILGLGMTGGIAGCVDDVNPLAESESDSPTRVENVPASAQGVAYGNVAGILSDTELREGVNEQISAFRERAGGFEGPATLDGWLDQLEESTGFDLREVKEVLGYWESGADGGAVVLWTDWSKEVITGQMSGYAEETYQGTTLYSPEYGGPVAVLSDGVYAIGSDEAVRSIIDVRGGRAEALSGQLRDVYDATRGMTRFAVDVPQLSTTDLVGEQAGGGASQYRQTADDLIQNVEYASASLYQEVTERALAMSLVAPSPDEAENLDGALTAGRQLALDQLEAMRSQATPGPMEQFLFDRIVTFTESATISRDGATVTVSYTAPPEEFARNSPALVLAVGVLFNTAGFLQTTAEETGEESTSQVADRLQVVNAVGEVSDGEISVVRVTVMKAPGAGDIGLDRVTAQLVTEEAVADFAHSAGAGSNFGIEPLRDDDDSLASEALLNDPADRATLVFDIGDDDVSGVDSSAVGGLPEGQQATVQLVTQSGGETVVGLTVPETLAGKDVVTL